ncbi:MAG TPA: glycosyltransferase [Solimonas sp.]|nr:glycosyltransferase [Solimonas sp.]
MRVLLVHNYYRASIPSGENTVFEAEGRLLEQAGHPVARLLRSNDEIADAPLRTALTASLLTTSNPFAAASLRREIARFRPEVVHFHNTFPLLSPALLRVAHDSGVAVVATLHNYRVICADGGLFREQRICTECLDQRSPAPGLRHGCYRHSRIATWPVARMIGQHLQQQTWDRHAHALLALTEFQRGLMLRAGLSPQVLQVKPNATAAATALPWAERDDVAVFVGRLCDEKGIWTLFEAWQRLGEAAPRLRIIGAGPALPALQQRLAGTALAARIELLGALPHAEAMAQLARARLLVYPSQWYEPFGMSVIEAYARGVPVLASRLGGLAELVRDGDSGALFEAGDPASLAQQVTELWQHPIRLQALAQRGLELWGQHYSPASNLARLETIYRNAIDTSRRSAAGH